VNLKYNNMAAPANKIGTYVWFEATEGSEVGTCPSCQERGVVETICRRCSVIPHWMCCMCYTEGPEGGVCKDCNVDFQEEVEMGECQNCQEAGICGTICNNCEDQCFIFE
jgi:hypothetical protein